MDLKFQRQSSSLKNGEDACDEIKRVRLKSTRRKNNIILFIYWKYFPVIL